MLVVLSFLLVQVAFAQSYEMDGTPITDCGGFFYDSGGSTGDYGSDESFTTTICSDGTDGTHIQLIFSAVDLQAGDEICFFDGTDTSSPLACNGDFNVGSPFIIQATAANTSGCLTITFNSDGSGESAGWQADINCIASCQTILADLVSTDPIVSPVDTGYIDICQGDRVFFNGAGIYPQDGIVYSHSDLTSSFEWDFGDGNIGLGPNVSHTYPDAGGYIVQLTITDQFGCNNTNFINQRVRVSTNPSFALLDNIPGEVCSGDTIELNAVVNDTMNNFTVGVNPNQGSFPTAGSRSDSLALPDGTGVAYETSIGFSNFSPGQVVTNVNDIVSICVVMEHSWMRDLEISLECPDGTSIILHDHPGQNGGEVFLGDPFEADESLSQPIPGTGAEYCWTPNATNGTWIEYANNVLTPFQNTLPEGNYSTFDPMSDLLGCPLNGEWTIRVEDLWGVDNGFIFEWSIAFDPSLYPNIETFTPQIVDYNWMDNPTIFFQTNDSIAAAPQNAGTASYSFQITDDFGCSYDTTVFIAVLPPTHPDCFSCPPTEPLLTDTVICDGGVVQIDAETTIGLSEQEIVFEAFPLYPIGAANHPANNPYAAGIDISSISPATINNAQAQICGVCLDLETDFDGDIRLFLRAPSGQMLELATGVGGAGDNFTNTCFRPSASTLINAGSAPFTGDFLPEGNWNALNGATINGTWELLVSDAFGPTRMGILNSWSICFNSQNDVEYDWSSTAGLSCYDCPDPQADPSITSTYTLETTDSYGCVLLDTMTVNVLPSISAPTNFTCDTSFNGTMSFVWDEVPGFSSYLVDVNGTGFVPANGSNSHVVSGLTNGDMVSIEIQANVGSSLCSVQTTLVSCTYFVCEISVEVDNVTPTACFDSADGSVIVQSMGNGTGPFTYTLDDTGSQGNGSFNSIAAGEHNIILRDVDGCADTVFFNVPAADSIFLDFEIDSVLCNGENSGSALAIGSGGTGTFSYAWNTSPLITPTDLLDDVSAGTYMVTLTDSGNPGQPCQITESITIDEPALLTGTISTTNVSCFGGTDGELTANPSGGMGDYTYMWSDGQTTAIAENLSIGTYTVSITDANGCMTMVTQPVIEPIGMTLMTNPTDVNCFGENNGAIDLEVMGGAAPFSYAWDNGTTAEDPTDLIENTYCVVVTDDNGCTVETCVTINQPTELTITLDSTQTTCAGNNLDGTATVLAQGGMGNTYTFLWSDGQTNSTANNLVANNYCVTVTDGNGCTAVSCIDVLDPSLVVVDSIIPTDVLCFGENNGFAEVFVSGGTGAGTYTYLWSDDLAQFSNPANSLFQGTYTVTVTDAGDCTATATITVGEPDLLTTTIAPTDVLCFGGNDGATIANPQGGTMPYTYVWNTLPAQTTETIDDLSAGTYNVTVTDANGCTATQTSIVTEPATAVTATVEQTFLGCFEENNSTAIVTPSGGTGNNYTFAWDNNPVSTTATANNLAPQNYVATVTDENGCQATANILIEELEDITINVIKIEPSCNGDADGQLGINIVTGGIGAGNLDNYNYLWDNNNTNQLNANLTSGDYLVTISDAQGCSSVNAVSLGEPIAITATAVVEDAKCFGSSDGQLVVTASGEFPIATYQWDNNANNQTTETASNLSIGNYLVTITDDTNCSIVANFEVNEPTPIEVSFATKDNPCYGDQFGEIETTVNGGTGGYTYSWSNNDTVTIFSATEPNLTELFADLYTVTITDENGCVEIDEIRVNAPDQLFATVESDSVTCFGDRDGSIFVEASGGSPPFTYSLDGDKFSATNTFLGLEEGEYVTYIKDGKGCETLASGSVGSPEEIIVDLGADININLRQAANFDATVTPAGNYIYSWTPSDSLNCTDCPNPVAVGLLNQTTYQLTVENEFGCKAKDLINVFVLKNRKVFVPTGFSPNDDSFNDVLRTHGEEGTIVNVFKIYDRWGELVYENAEPFGINEEGIGWDGSFRGEKLNPAVFVWQLEVTYIDGATDVMKGQTTLVK